MLVAAQGGVVTVNCPLTNLRHARALPAPRILSPNDGIRKRTPLFLAGSAALTSSLTEPLRSYEVQPCRSSAAGGGDFKI